MSTVAPQSFHVARPGGQLAGEVWPGTGPTAVLLHSGIGDRRSWDAGLDAWSQAASVTLPTLVCWGPLDLPPIVARSAELARRIPGATSVELPGTAHLPYLEQPGPFTA